MLEFKDLMPKKDIFLPPIDNNNYNTEVIIAGKSI